MLEVEAAFDVAIPDSELTPQNFATVGEHRAAGAAAESGGLTIDRGAKRFLDALNAAARKGAPTVAQLRAAAVELARCAAPAPPVERRDETLGALRLRDLRSARPRRAYFAGAGLSARRRAGGGRS